MGVSLLANSHKQFRLQNELALLVLFRRLIGLVVLPAHGLTAAAAKYVADDVATGGHVAFGGLGGVDIDDFVKEVGLTVLAAEVLCLRDAFRVSQALFMCARPVREGEKGEYVLRIHCYSLG